MGEGAVVIHLTGVSAISCAFCHCHNLNPEAVGEHHKANCFCGDFLYKNRGELWGNCHGKKHTSL